MTISLHALTELLALRFLDCLAEGTFVCLLVALVLRVAPRQSAATRFALWFSALVAIAVLPWISGAWPHAGIASAATRQAAITLPNSLAFYSLGLWAAIALWLSSRVARAFWHLKALRRNCISVDVSNLDPVLQETLRRHGRNRTIALCISDEVQVPTAVGLLKPAILIPRWVMQELSTVELNQILLHELAHFRRWDDWTNLAEQLIKALLFFHPAVWWIDNRVAVEREMACDDAVLAETSSPRAYAECLAHLAEKSFVNRSLALAQAALGKLRQTSARVAQILDLNRPAQSSRPWRPAVTLVAALAMACAAFYSSAPKLIAFQNSSPADSPEMAAASPKADSVDRRAAQNTPLPVIQAKFKEIKKTAATPKSTPVRPAVSRTKSPKPAERSLVHLVKSNSATLPFTETFWVVVERGADNPAMPQVYQIQMWRVTVLRTVTGASSHQVPPKET